MKDRPVKSGVYITLLGTTIAALRTNPTEADYFATHTQNLLNLMLVGEKIRNPYSQAAMDNVAILKNEGRLKAYNLGICSLMCEREFSTDLGLFSANCKYVQPHWTEFHKSIIDVGVFGRWVNLDKAMVDYDINPDEWLQDGSPNPDFKHYKKYSIHR